MISRKRLHRANQIAQRHWERLYKPEYMYDIWGCHRAEIIDLRLFGIYRKTRAFKFKYNIHNCNCFYCLTKRKYGRQKIQSDINYREQLRELSVI